MNSEPGVRCTTLFSGHKPSDSQNQRVYDRQKRYLVCTKIILRVSKVLPNPKTGLEMDTYQTAIWKGHAAEILSKLRFSSICITGLRLEFGS